MHATRPDPTARTVGFRGPANGGASTRSIRNVAGHLRVSDRLYLVRTCVGSSDPRGAAHRVGCMVTDAMMS